MSYKTLSFRSRELCIGPQRLLATIEESASTMQDFELISIPFQDVAEWNPPWNEVKNRPESARTVFAHLESVQAGIRKLCLLHSENEIGAATSYLRSMSHADLQDADNIEVGLYKAMTSIQSAENRKRFLDALDAHVSGTYSSNKDNEVILSKGSGVLHRRKVQVQHDSDHADFSLVWHADYHTSPELALAKTKEKVYRAMFPQKLKG